MDIACEVITVHDQSGLLISVVEPGDPLNPGFTADEIREVIPTGWYVDCRRVTSVSEFKNWATRLKR